MKPYVICHMVSTVDGRIDCAALEGMTGEDEYDVTGATLEGDAWLCGRATMQLHFADEKPFVSASNRPAGPQPVHVARRADAYVVSVDTLGRLGWSSDEIDGAHLICLVSERAPEDYLTMLRSKGISYIVAGEPTIDLARAMDLLGEHFGIRRLLLEGGGHINGAFLEAGLVDEVSLLLAPAVDGRHDIPTVFDGIRATRETGIALTLKSVETRAGGTLWIRYSMNRQRANGKS